MTISMKPKLFSVEIESPFSSDTLNREPEIKNLQRLVENLSSPAVIAVNGRWGTGKTSFLKMWGAHIEGKSSDALSLYFNAWETDFSTDPLIAFLGEMNTQLTGFVHSESGAGEAWEKTKKVGGQIARKGVPAILKVVTAGALDTDSIIEQVSGDFIGELADKAVDAYLEQRGAIEEFKSALETVVAARSIEQPMVIFIDELDRCRPDYALALLERMKHLFNISGIVFVLGIDKQQMCNSVVAVYGRGIDANDYLRRFIDYTYELQAPSREAFVRKLIDDYGVSEIFENRTFERGGLENEKEQAVATIKILSSRFDLSLRELEQLVAVFSLSLRLAEFNRPAFPMLMIFLIVLREKEHDVYLSLQNPKASDRVPINFLRELFEDDSYYETENKIFRYLEAEIIAAKRSLYDGQTHHYESDVMRGYENTQNVSGRVRDPKSAHAGNVLGIYHSNYFNFSPVLTELVERITFAGKVSLSVGAPESVD